MQHDWPVEQCVLHIRVFFDGKTKRPLFDLFIHWLMKQITNTYRNQFSRSYENRSKVVLCQQNRTPKRWRFVLCRTTGRVSYQVASIAFSEESTRLAQLSWSSVGVISWSWIPQKKNIQVQSEKEKVQNNVSVFSWQVVPVGAPYFVAEFDNGERLLHRVTHKMPLQFGRY